MKTKTTMQILVKIDKLKKMLAYLKVSKYVATDFSASWFEQIKSHLKDPKKMFDRDTILLSFESEKPEVISIYTDLESGHNGSSFDRYYDEVPIDITFLDYAIDEVEQVVKEKVRDQLRKDADKRFERRVAEELAEILR
jgi:hypothetical protein